MKVDRKLAVALLVSLGFEKAGGWDDEKVVSRITQVPGKVEAGDVDEKFKDLYKELAETEGKIELTGGEVKEEKEKSAPAAKAKAKKAAVVVAPDFDAMDKKQLATFIEENEALEVTIPKKASLEEVRKRVVKAYAAMVAAKAAAAEVAKPAKEVKEKPAKLPPVEKKKVERDAFGCKLGTISAKVNTVVEDEWKTVEDIIKEAGVTKDQALGRLYWGAEKGEFEHRRLIQYRVAPAKK